MTYFSSIRSIKHILLLKKNLYNILMNCDVLNISVCFRFADRAGLSHGCIEPNFQYELCGALHETGRPLAEAGQPKGKLTIHLLSSKSTCKPFVLPLSTFTSPRLSVSHSELDYPSGLCQASLLHMDVISSHVVCPWEYTTDQCTCYLLFSLMSARVSLSLWHFYEHVLHLWLYTHFMSCTHGVSSCSSSSVHVFESSIYSGVTLTTFGWEHIECNQNCRLVAAPASCKFWHKSCLWSQLLSLQGTKTIV